MLSFIYLHKVYLFTQGNTGIPPVCLLFVCVMSVMYTHILHSGKSRFVCSHRYQYGYMSVYEYYPATLHPYFNSLLPPPPFSWLGTEGCSLPNFFIFYFLIFRVYLQCLSYQIFIEFFIMFYFTRCLFYSQFS